MPLGLRAGELRPERERLARSRESRPAAREYWGHLPMPVRSGRLEKRIQRVVPVEISTLQDPRITERVSTENISPLGARIVTQRSIEQNARLLIRSLAGNQRTAARVVYCQRMPDGRFSVGMQFLGVRVNWPSDPGGPPIR